MTPENCRCGGSYVWYQGRMVCNRCGTFETETTMPFQRDCGCTRGEECAECREKTRRILEASRTCGHRHPLSNGDYECEKPKGHTGKHMATLRYLEW